MDGITFSEASMFYSLLFAPLLSMVLLFFWASANMKNIAKTQLFGIVILLVVGFVAINSPMFLLIEAIAFILFVIWFFVYRKFLPRDQLPVILLVFALQVVYYTLYFTFIGLVHSLATLLLCIIPLLSMILLYPWTFGNKSSSKGQVFVVIVFFVQVIHAFLNIVLGGW